MNQDDLVGHVDKYNPIARLPRSARIRLLCASKSQCADLGTRFGSPNSQRWFSKTRFGRSLPRTWQFATDSLMGAYVVSADVSFLPCAGLRDSLTRTHGRFAGIPGTVALSVTADRITPLHEFGHAASNLDHGLIDDLYVDRLQPVFVVNKIARATSTDPVPAAFATYNATAFNSDLWPRFPRVSDDLEVVSLSAPRSDQAQYDGRLHHDQRPALLPAGSRHVCVDFPDRLRAKIFR